MYSTRLEGIAAELPICTDDDCEAIALEASRASGLDDRPNADPSVLAVSWAGLRVRPEPHARPHVADGVIVYPARAAPEAVAYFVAHELGHELLRWAGVKLERAEEERAASRIGSALLLPRRAFVRDLHATRAGLVELRALWPLASPWVLARRACEVSSASAAQFSPSGRRMRRAGAESLDAADAVSVDGALVALRL